MGREKEIKYHFQWLGDKPQGRVKCQHKWKKMRQEIKKEKSNMNIRKSSTADDHRNKQNTDRNPKMHNDSTKLNSKNVP